MYVYVSVFDEQYNEVSACACAGWILGLHEQAGRARYMAVSTLVALCCRHLVQYVSWCPRSL